MTDWLSEIEERNHQLRLTLSQESRTYEYETEPETDRERMARVLRELGEFIQGLDLKEYKEWFKTLSDDAKELCIAARESSRE